LLRGRIAHTLKRKIEIFAGFACPAKAKLSRRAKNLLPLSFCLPGFNGESKNLGESILL